MANIYRAIYLQQPPSGSSSSADEDNQDKVKVDHAHHRRKKNKGGHAHHKNLGHAHHLSEPLLSLDNVTFVFGHLYHEEQAEVVRIYLLPHLAQLLRNRYAYMRRLVALLRTYVANYEVHELTQAILPLATGLLNSLAAVRCPESELYDPRGKC